ncbi:MAG: helix-turn-helix domain-containing protein, partial [Planctomycetes bacterium]|nr:helix-turn-helix domain-containing protein [Planctomycetota bacterium]
MKSYEVMREASERVGVKALAAKLGLSTAMVYKWCQESPKDDPDSSGARNPLDRMKEIYEITQEPRLINWLCNHAGGFFVQNPAVEP